MILSNERIKVLNIEIDNYSSEELLHKLKKGVLITPNVDHLVKLQKDQEFYSIYKKAEFITLDSQIVRMGLRFLKTPAKELITGSGFFPKFCDYHKNNNAIKIFILGAGPGIAEIAAKKINKRCQRDIIVGYYSPSFGFDKNETECNKIIELTKNTPANVLAVGVGAPKQEKWIFKYKEQLCNIDIFMAIGATIDFEAGVLQRAPVFFQKIGLEWFFRLLKEPKRLFKRYLIEDPKFFLLLLKQKLGVYKNPFKDK